MPDSVAGIAFLVEDAGLAVKAADQVPGNAYMAAPGEQERIRQQASLARLNDARIEQVMDREPLGADLPARCATRRCAVR